MLSDRDYKNRYQEMLRLTMKNKANLHHADIAKPVIKDFTKKTINTNFLSKQDKIFKQKYVTTLQNKMNIGIIKDNSSNEIEQGVMPQIEDSRSQGERLNDKVLQQQICLTNCKNLIADPVESNILFNRLNDDPDLLSFFNDHFPAIKAKYAVQKNIKAVFVIQALEKMMKIEVETKGVNNPAQADMIPTREMLEKLLHDLLEKESSLSSASHTRDASLVDEGDFGEFEEITEWEEVAPELGDVIDKLEAVLAVLPVEESGDLITLDMLLQLGLPSPESIENFLTNEDIAGFELLVNDFSTVDAQSINLFNDLVESGPNPSGESDFTADVRNATLQNDKAIENAQRHDEMNDVDFGLEQQHPLPFPDSMQPSAILTDLLEKGAGESIDTLIEIKDHINEALNTHYETLDPYDIQQYEYDLQIVQNLIQNFYNKDLIAVGTPSFDAVKISSSIIDDLIEEVSSLGSDDEVRDIINRYSALQQVLTETPLTTEFIHQVEIKYNLKQIAKLADAGLTHEEFRNQIRRLAEPLTKEAIQETYDEITAISEQAKVVKKAEKEVAVSKSKKATGKKQSEPTEAEIDRMASGKKSSEFDPNSVGRLLLRLKATRFGNSGVHIEGLGIFKANSSKLVEYKGNSTDTEDPKRWTNMSSEEYGNLVNSTGQFPNITNFKKYIMFQHEFLKNTAQEAPVQKAVLTPKKAEPVPTVEIAKAPADTGGYGRDIYDEYPMDNFKGPSVKGHGFAVSKKKSSKSNIINNIMKQINK